MKKPLRNRWVPALFLIAVLMMTAIWQKPVQTYAYQTRSGNFNQKFTLTDKGDANMQAVAKAQVNKTEGQLKYTEPWCADFVLDCARLAGVSTSVIDYERKLNANCGEFYRNLVNKCGAVVVDASARKAGDLVFYYRPATKGYLHVGIYDKDGYFIEGNVSDKVTRFNGHYYGNKAKTIGTHNGTIQRVYVRPKYTGITPTPVPSVAFSNTATGKQFTISGASGTTLYYTLNGGNQMQYSGPITLTKAGNYTVDAWAVKNGVISAHKTAKTTVAAAPAPTISYVERGTSAVVTVYHSNPGASIYYATGSNYYSYSNSFTLTSSATVKAYARINGMAQSSTVSKEIKITKPQPPNVTIGNGQKASVRDAVILSWNNQSNVSSYSISVKKDGQEIDTRTTAGTTASFSFDEAGTYSFTVTASNAFGSATSGAVSISLMPDVTVIFEDDEGNALSELYTIPYGGSVTPPKTPVKEGHDFVKWNGTYTNVKEDSIVVAEFEKKTYQVTFFDQDGSRLKTEKVAWHESANAPDMTNKAPTGYVFAGWNVDTSSECSDYTCVDGRMSLYASYAWANPNLPIYIDGLKVKSESRTSTGQEYSATMNLICSSDEEVDGRVILEIQTAAGTTVAVRTQDITIQAGATMPVTVSAVTALDGSKAKVYVVGLTGDGKTAGACSEEASAPVTRTVYYSDWSDWTTALPDNLPEDAVVESKTQYRYKTRATATSTTSNTMSGYTLYDTTSSTGSWSGWQDAAVSAVNTAALRRVVNTKDVVVSYTYGHYCTGNVTGAKYQTSYSNNTTNSTFNSKCTYHSIGNFSPTNSQIQTASDGNGGYFYFKGGSSTKYRCSNTCYRWYRMSTNTKKQYQYQDTTFKYYFEKISDWSAWSDTRPSSYYQLGQRTLYRYKTVTDSGEVNELNNTETLSVDGTIPAETDFAGRKAIAMVYKQTNTDPTENQLEYVSQITIGSNNSFSFNVIPRENLSAETGDFIVALAIEGSERLVNAAVISAPKALHTVVFEVDGEVISTQQVENGHAAVVPEAPVLEGKNFVRWDTQTSCITQNTYVSAEYEDKQYVVVYVDSMHGTADLTYADYGTSISREAPEAPEGYVFAGWDADIVNGDMIVNAIYNKKSYEVTFVAPDGSNILTQEVEHGQSATPPDISYLSVPAGMTISGWSRDTSWWAVDSDMVVVPLVAYAETTSSPEAMLSDTGQEDGSVEVSFDTLTDNAVVYYTTDGSVPDLENLDQLQVYTGPFTVSESVTIKAIATYEDMNASPVSTYEIEVVPDQSLNESVDDTGYASGEEQSQEESPADTGNVPGTTSPAGTSAGGKQPVVGEKVTVNGMVYIVTETANGKAEVALTAVDASQKKKTSVTIPDTVQIAGKTYMVTGIGNDLFKKSAKLKKVVIGKNVKKIGKKAFFGCKNLKTIIFKTKKLKAKTVGAKAFSGTHKKATVKVPKSVKAKYKKFLVKRGISKKAKFK